MPFQLLTNLIDITFYLGEVGELLNGVVVELKGFDEEEEKGIKGFFKKKISKAQTLKLRYSKIEGNIDEICEKLEGHQVQLLKDSAMLDQLYELNKDTILVSSRS